jgi:hypothetical protein
MVEEATIQTYEDQLLEPMSLLEPDSFEKRRLTRLLLKCSTTSLAVHADVDDETVRQTNKQTIFVYYYRSPALHRQLMDGQAVPPA